MSFAYDATKHAAINPKNGAQVKAARKRFDDDIIWWPYEYRTGDLTIEFDVAIGFVDRSYRRDDGTPVQVVDFGCYISEWKIRGGFAKAWQKVHGADPVDEARYRQVKAEIGEGIVALVKARERIGVPPNPDLRPVFVYSREDLTGVRLTTLTT